MEWQVNWKSWRWPWHTAELVSYYTTWELYNFVYWSHFAGIGPFQFHWNSSQRRL